MTSDFSVETLNEHSAAVFAVKKTLITDFARVDDPAEAARYGVTSPFRQANFEIVLQPA